MFKLEISYRGLLTLLVVLVVLWAITEVWAVILLTITAIIFMAALLPYVEWLCRHRVPRAAAVLGVLFAILLIIGGLFALVVPAMVDEFTHLKENLPQDAQRLEDLLADFGIDVELSDPASDIDWGELVSGRVAIDYGQRVLLAFISGITVLVMTAYLLIEAPAMKTYLYRFVPDPREPDADELLRALGRVVGGYIRGQIITSGIIALYTLIVLVIVGVPNPIAFAVLAGFADIIPLVGAFIAVGPATLAAFQESPTQALIVLGALILYQQFEDRILVPRIYGSTLGIPPLVVLIAVLVGGELLGVPGILLGLPAASAAKVGLDYFLARRHPGNAFAPRDEAAEVAEVAAPDDSEP